jgi:hypothetical protein
MQVMTNEEMEKKHTAPEANSAPLMPLMSMPMPTEAETQTANLGEDILAAVTALLDSGGG